MHIARPLVLSLCIGWACVSQAQERQPAPQPEAGPGPGLIKLPLPWKAGETLEYQTERVETAAGPGKREKTVSSSTSRVRTLEAGADGFLQEWSWRDSSRVVVEGDKAQEALAAGMAEKLSAIRLQVELEPDGSYRKVRNLAEVAAQIREAIRPAMLQMTTAEVERAVDGQPEHKRKAALERVPGEVDGYLARLTAPGLLENMMTNEIQTVLNFSGVELEDDQAYELETTLDNPAGTTPFPARLTFGLYVDEDEPEDVNLEWTLRIDPEKGAAAVWETVEHLYGRKFTEAERKEMPAQVSIEDRGFIVFDRASGLPELFQNVRDARVGENASYRRDRMRLLGNRHGHAWREEDARDTDPRLSSGEQDAQACAHDDADLEAAIAACSRLLAGEGLEPKARARWHARRAFHRERGRQDALAIADYGKAIALQPGDIDYLLARARVHGRAGDHAAALADANRALDVQPASAPARLRLGIAHEGLQDYRQAEQAYDWLVRRYPDDPLGYGARCWARAMQGDYEGARADCDRAIALDARDWNSYNSRGFVHYRLGLHADAVRDYDAALAGQPGVASSWYMRGMAKRALGDVAGAEADIAKGLQLDPQVAARYAGHGVEQAGE